MPAPRKHHSRKNAPMTLRAVLFFTLAFSIVVASLSVCLCVSLLFYQSSEHTAEVVLSDRTHALSEMLSGQNIEKDLTIVENQLSTSTRLTLIDESGQVLFDSFVPADQMENHANRPEIIEALSAGDAQVTRHSKTVGTDLVYTAASFVDASGETFVIRLSQERKSFEAYGADIAAPLMVFLILAIAAAFGIAHVLTRRVLLPINGIRVDEPLSSKTYAEVTPLLIRIDEQQKRMADQQKRLADQAHHLEIQRRDLMHAQNVRREFSANVSHEMKTPLTVIAGYAELLMNNLVKPDDQQRVAGLIYDESQHLRSLIDDVLIISRMEESSPLGADARGEFIDLADVATRVCARLDAAAQMKEITIERDISYAPIWGVATYCEQMIYNLVDNAIRYSYEGGHIRVSVGQDEAASTSFVRVQDEGAGIAPQFHEKIFERFYRVDESHSKATGGTGLGLAIVKHAVQAQNGEISLESEEGRGSTFLVKFPLARA